MKNNETDNKPVEPQRMSFYELMQLREQMFSNLLSITDSPLEQRKIMDYRDSRRSVFVPY